MNLLDAGKKIDDIQVKISYKIIELFSAGLYSSPNNANFAKTERPFRFSGAAISF